MFLTRGNSGAVKPQGHNKILIHNVRIYMNPWYILICWYSCSQDTLVVQLFSGHVCSFLDPRVCCTVFLSLPSRDTTCVDFFTHLNTKELHTHRFSASSTTLLQISFQVQGFCQPSSCANILPFTTMLKQDSYGIACESVSVSHYGD